MFYYVIGGCNRRYYFIYFPNKNKKNSLNIRGGFNCRYNLSNY